MPFTFQETRRVATRAYYREAARLLEWGAGKEATSMTEINPETFCRNLGDRKDWDTEKVSRLESFLRKRGAYGPKIKLERLTELVTEFLDSESPSNPPPDAPLTDTS
jgi:hypothetical protein